MKTIFTTIILSFATSLSQAASVDKSQIASDAKWLVHINVDQFENSQFGAFAIEQLKLLVEEENDSSIALDIDDVFQEIKSITAYGSTLEEDPQANSVLIVSAGEKVQSIIEGLVTNELMKEDVEVAIEELENMPYTTFLIDNEVYMSFPKPRLIMISKTQKQIERALDVIDGRRPSLEDEQSELVLFEDDGFFLMASAQGIDDLKNIPPQARVLKKATGGQVSFGARGEELVAQIILSTRDSEVAKQLSRIVEGMIALASFVDLREMSLDGLISSIDVSHGKDRVTIDFAYSYTEIIRLVEIAQNHENGKQGAPKGPKKEFGEEIADATGGEELQIAYVDGSTGEAFPRHAIDNDPDTAWSAEGRGAWLRFELGSQSLVRELQLDMRKSDIRKTKLTVEVSKNGKDWTRLIRKESSGVSKGFESFNIPNISTKWIRLKFHGNSQNAWNVLKEIKLLGEPNQAPPEVAESE